MVTEARAGLVDTSDSAGMPIEWDHRMSERHEDEGVRIQECELQAQAMMAAARSAKTEETKSEFLRLATEWMKLAAAISKRLGDL